MLKDKIKRPPFLGRQVSKKVDLFHKGGYLCTIAPMMFVFSIHNQHRNVKEKEMRKMRVQLYKQIYTHIHN